MDNTDLAIKILHVLNISPNTELKKKIRGLNGITAQSLVTALISSSNLEEAAKLLGYSTSPVKDAIRKCLQPKFPERQIKFASSIKTLTCWRRTLLTTIQYKHCNLCGRSLPYDRFTNRVGKSDGLQSNCSSCRAFSSVAYKLLRSKRVPAWSEKVLIQNFYNNCPSGYHVDHILPISGELVSGLHVLANLQYLPAQENIAKGNRVDLDEYNRIHYNT